MKAHSSPFLNAFYQVSTFSIFNGLSPGLLLSIRPSYHDPQVHRSRCQRPYFRHFHHLPHLRLRSHGNDGNRLSCPPSGNLSDSSRLLRGTKHRTAEGTVAPRRPAATPPERFTPPDLPHLPSQGSHSTGINQRHNCLAAPIHRFGHLRKKLSKTANLSGRPKKSQRTNKVLPCYSFYSYYRYP